MHVDLLKREDITLFYGCLKFNQISLLLFCFLMFLSPRTVTGNVAPYEFNSKYAYAHYPFQVYIFRFCLFSKFKETVLEVNHEIWHVFQAPEKILSVLFAKVFPHISFPFLPFNNAGLRDFSRLFVMTVLWSSSSREFNCILYHRCTKQNGMKQRK